VNGTTHNENHDLVHDGTQYASDVAIVAGQELRLGATAGGLTATWLVGNIVHGRIVDIFGGPPHHYTITPNPDNPLEGLLECSCGHKEEMERDEPLKSDDAQ
jgi:hypothetical protein